MPTNSSITAQKISGTDGNTLEVKEAKQFIH